MGGIPTREAREAYTPGYTLGRTAVYTPWVYLRENRCIYTWYTSGCVRERCTWWVYLRVYNSGVYGVYLKVYLRVYNRSIHKGVPQGVYQGVYLTRFTVGLVLPAPLTRFTVGLAMPLPSPVSLLGLFLPGLIFPFHCGVYSCRPCAGLLSVPGFSLFLSRFTVGFIPRITVGCSSSHSSPVSLLASSTVPGRLIPHKVDKVDIPGRTKR